MPNRGSRARRDEIVRLAVTSGLASVEELSRTFGVTPSTIRRDLALLTSDGQLARTYGGAMPITVHPESPLRQRSGEALAAKQSIARYAAELIRSGETVMLDAGSTVGALARELRVAENLTVVTTGLTALHELTTAEDVTVHCLGGTLRPMSEGFVGPIAEAALERMSFDRVFLGADGVTTEGLCEAELVQTRLKELMARRADHVYVLAHSAKLGRRPFHAWARLDPGWHLITDTEADPVQVEKLRAAGIEVSVVGPDPTP